MTPFELFILALSLSVILLFLGLPLLPGLSSLSSIHWLIFLILSRMVLMYLFSFSMTSKSFSSTSVLRCFFKIRRIARSIFCFFLKNSALVPLHSFDALEGILQPSMANMSLPIKSNSLQIKSTSRNSPSTSCSMDETKLAIVVK